MLWISQCLGSHQNNVRETHKDRSIRFLNLTWSAIPCREFYFPQPLCFQFYPNMPCLWKTVIFSLQGPSISWFHHRLIKYVGILLVYMYHCYHTWSSALPLENPPSAIELVPVQPCLSQFVTSFHYLLFSEYVPSLLSEFPGNSLWCTQLMCPPYCRWNWGYHLLYTHILSFRWASIFAFVSIIFLLLLPSHLFYSIA